MTASRFLATLAVGAIVLASGEAQACSCASLSAAERLFVADEAFAGRVDSAFVVRADTAQVAYFTTDAWWKGSRSPRLAVAVVWNRERTSCDGPFFVEGERYVVYGRLEPDGRVTTHFCLGTQRTDVLDAVRPDWQSEVGASLPPLSWADIGPKAERASLRSVPPQFERQSRSGWLWPLAAVAVVALIAGFGLGRASRAV